MAKQWLLSNGFNYNRLLSDEEIESYAYRFPVYKCEGFIILECELRVILGNSYVYVDVYGYNTINKYSPFYFYEYGEYSILLGKIWQEIEKETKRLGITKAEEGIKNGSKNQKIKKNQHIKNENNE